MKSLFLNPKSKNILHSIIILAVIVILNTLTPHSVKAQEELEPQLVTATYYNSDCFPAGSNFRIEIYNVGSQGGEAYSQAIYTYAISHIGNHPDGGIACFVDGYEELYGTFTGGRDGTITFPPDNSQGITTCQVMDGKTIICNYYHYSEEFGVAEGTNDFTIVNPEAFQPGAIPTLEPTATPGVGCTPTVRGLEPAKPGDVISPGASYVDPSGKETGIIQERWYFNGKESTSIVWDGNPVTVELQWTCLDHSGFAKTFNIPAYTVTPAQTGGEPESDKSNNTSDGRESPGRLQNITPLGIVVLVGGALGALGAVGVGIGLLLKPASPVPSAPVPSAPVPSAPVPSAPLPSSLPSPVTPVNYTPPSPPVQYIPPIQTEPPLPLPPAQPAGLTNVQRGELITIRKEMETEVEDLKTKWRADRDAVEKLKDLLQKNLLKFTVKKGFDVSEWIMDSPVELINKVAIDPLMEKVFEKHDTSQDSNIILNINNRIQQLQGEMQELVNQEKYLQTEISKINQKLG